MHTCSFILYICISLYVFVLYVVRMCMCMCFNTKFDTWDPWAMAISQLTLTITGLHPAQDTISWCHLTYSIVPCWSLASSLGEDYLTLKGVSFRARAAAGVKMSPWFV